MRLMKFAGVAFAAMVWVAQCGAASAQASNGAQPIVEYERRQDQESRLQSFGTDLLGDQIDPATGALSFAQTDVVLPGNSHLDVSIRRRRSQGYLYRHDIQAEFGDWTLETPRINVISGPNAWTGARCGAGQDVTLPPYQIGTQYYVNRDYSEGVVLDVPGGGSQQILWPTGGTWPGPQWPSGTQHVTTENWRFLCNVTASDGGEGFTGIAPNGDTYRFDRLITRPYEPLDTVGGVGGLVRNRNYLVATRVTDVNGNTVDYTYDASGRLTQISANDGRLISISYQGASQLIYQATANGRTWTYAYGASTWDGNPEIGDNPAQIAQLRTVVLPDSTAWVFQLDGMEGEPSGGLLCHQLGSTLKVTHPNGAVGTFQTFNHRHRQSLDLLTPYTKFCPGSQEEYNPPGQPIPMYTGAAFKSLSVTSKSITAPGAPTATWTYSYEGDAGNPITGLPPGPECVSGEPCHTNRTVVQEPNGRHLTYYHYWTAEFGVAADLYQTPLPPGNPLGGKLARLEIRDGGPSGTLLETTDYSYFLENNIGTTFARTGFVAFTMINPTRTNRVTITRSDVEGSSDWFRTDNAFDSGFSSSNYSYGFPISVVETSSTASGLSRTTSTVYAHNKTKWVLGLPSTVTRNGKLFDSYAYDTLGRVWTHSQFGSVDKTFSYNTASGQQGTIATITDSHSPAHVWTLSNWKRGRPQSILYPNSDTFSRVVDNNGWVTSETDGRNLTTSFTYNNLGWLKSVTPPPPFNATTINYSGLASGIQEVRTKGGKKTTTSYDGYVRPTLIKTEATDGSTPVIIYLKTQYDALGRPIFQSWPSSSSSPTAGVDTTYDALSRPLTVAENVSPYATTTTQYISGETVRVIDPSGAAVTTTNRAFGNPSETEAMRIVDAMGAITTTTRDIYGNVTQLDQSGTQNGFTASVTRQFWYDNSLRLCRHRAPEFGDEIFRYDNEGLLIESGRGAAPNTTCPSTISSTIKVTHGYDGRHRETSINFPAGTPGVTRSYDGNSNVTNVTRAGGAVWGYTYTALDAIATEQLAIDGRTYVIGHGYTANGDLALRSNSHSGLSIDFNANAYGQPRRARVGAIDYISGATYHVNGLPDDATYLNGQVFLQTLNTRQLPDQLKTSKPGGATAVWQTYVYDARRKIDAITDSVSANESRDYSYDANGRLLTATGPWGTNGAQAAGSYVYDALGNVRSWTQGAKTGTVSYDATNRVSTYAKTGEATRNFTYDARGNVAGNGDNTFTYDFASQPVSIGGAIPATHAYDGNFKRVKTVENGKTVYQVFSRATGGLVYRDEFTDGETTDYVSVGGAALRLKETGSTLTPEYVHFDHQGSAVAATDASGAVLWRERYSPWGTRLLKPAGNKGDTGYTGHLMDNATELVYMQARYYDSQIGRFYSTDPIGYEDQLNLYAYVHNDPVNALDPDGNRCVTANASSVYCLRREIYRVFDQQAGQQTRFFGAAAATVEYLANNDIPFFGNVVTDDTEAFLKDVSATLYSLNASTYSGIVNGTISGSGLDRKLVHMEQTKVQSMLDALPKDQRDTIVKSLNAAFNSPKRNLSNFLSASDRRYNDVIDSVTKSLGGPIDFANQAHREAIGNSLINAVRSNSRSRIDKEFCIKHGITCGSGFDVWE